MANDLTISMNNLPAHVQARMGKSKLSEAMSGGLGGDSTPHISIKGGRFRVMEEGTETVLDTTTLKVAIVGINPRLSKTYYEGAWQQGEEAKAPDCFSLDGIKPDAQAAKPQNDVCANCPKNAWGSKRTPDGKDIKACTDQKRLAIVPAEDPKAGIYLLRVTPAALKSLNQYSKKLAQHNLPPEVVITNISFDTDASFPKLQFAYGGFLDEEVQEYVDSLIGTPEVLQITGEPTEVQPEPAPSKPVLVKETPKAAEPEPEPEPTPEPKAKATGFGAGKAAKVAKADADEPKKDLASMVGALLDGEDDD
jgi:hypothetical protein